MYFLLIDNVKDKVVFIAWKVFFYIVSIAEMRKSLFR